MNSHVEIVVSDTGEGIAGDVLPFIFDRFSQADSSSTRGHGGLGLGLALVKHLVELHGGDVDAPERRRGTGATFTVTLPLAIAEHPGGAGAAPHPHRGRRVEAPLPARSDSTGSGSWWSTTTAMRSTSRRRSSRAPAPTVKTCCSAPEALAVLPEWRPDVLVSDIEMPGEDGLLADPAGARARPGARGRHPGRRADRLRTHPGSDRSLTAGYTMHVPKPVDPGELTTIIASLAARPPHAGG